VTISQVRFVNHRQSWLTALLVVAALAACQTIPSNGEKTAPSRAAPLTGLRPPQRVNAVLSGRVQVPSSLKVAAGVTLISNIGSSLVSNNSSSLIANNSGGMMGRGAVAMRNALAFGLQQVGEWAISLAQVQGARLILVDAADKRLPVADEIKTDDTGAFRFTGVPAGYSYVVKAEVPTGDNKVAVFRALVKVTELGASIDIDPASTMVTTSIVADLPRGDIGEFSPGKFKSARETVAAKLTSANLPDFTDAAAVQASIKALSSQIADLRELLSDLQGELKEVKQSLDDLRNRTQPPAIAPSPVASPTTPPSFSPSLTPTPVASAVAPSPLTSLVPSFLPSPIPASTMSPLLTLSGVVTTLAGSTQGYADDTGAAAQFSGSTGVAVDAAGNVYVADNYNHRIRKVSPTGVVTTLAGSTQGYADGTGAAAQCNNPSGVAVDVAGNVYVADWGNNRIRKVSPAGVVTTLAGSTQGYADGTGAAAKFDGPVGVAVDAAGNVYAADSSNRRICKVSPAGVVTTLAGSTKGYADGTGAAAKFDDPAGVAVDASGNVYVADWGNNRIRKVSPVGVVTTLAGSTRGYSDGTGASAKFSNPTGVAVDEAGNVYVADWGNNRIRKVSPAGVVTTLAGSTKGYADGTGAAAQFSLPSCVAIDGAGTIYVGDHGNHRIRKIQ